MKKKWKNDKVGKKNLKKKKKKKYFFGKKEVL
jgi:hypothetical protein